MMKIIESLRKRSKKRGPQVWRIQCDSSKSRNRKQGRRCRIISGGGDWVGGRNSYEKKKRDVSFSIARKKVKGRC